MIKVTATKKFKFAGVQVDAGEVFEVDQKKAKVLLLLKFIAPYSPDDDQPKKPKKEKPVIFDQKVADLGEQKTARHYGKQVIKNDKLKNKTSKPKK